jgi:hypothetical protein
LKVFSRINWLQTGRDVIVLSVVDMGRWRVPDSISDESRELRKSDFLRHKAMLESSLCYDPEGLISRKAPLIPPPSPPPSLTLPSYTPPSPTLLSQILPSMEGRQRKARSGNRGSGQEGQRCADNHDIWLCRAPTQLVSGRSWVSCRPCRRHQRRCR